LLSLPLRFTKEIIQDLSSTYEMPTEATEWVRKMIKYTVDGGKMNRGLATVSVIETFAKKNGQKLTKKVC
jgi:geranylgeranyl pyrophosphate synthase